MVNNITSTLSEILGTLQLIAVPVAAVMVAFAGFQFFRGGDEGPMKAKKSLVYLLVGLVLVFGAKAIVDGVRANITFTILPIEYIKLLIPFK